VLSFPTAATSVQQEDRLTHHRHQQQHQPQQQQKPENNGEVTTLNDDRTASTTSDEISSLYRCRVAVFGKKNCNKSETGQIARTKVNIDDH